MFDQPHRPEFEPGLKGLLQRSRWEQRVPKPEPRGPKHLTLAGVMLTLCEDLCEDRARNAYRYSPNAVITKVILQRESVASKSGYVASYLWCEYTDEDFVIDTGRLPYMVRSWNRRQKTHSETRNRINPAAYEISEGGQSTYLVTGSHSDPQPWMTYHSVPYETPFLIRAWIDYSYDSDNGECDCHISSELLYIEGHEERITSALKG